MIKIKLNLVILSILTASSVMKPVFASQGNNQINVQRDDLNNNVNNNVINNDVIDDNPQAKFNKQLERDLENGTNVAYERLVSLVWADKSKAKKIIELFQRISFFLKKKYFEYVSPNFSKPDGSYSPNVFTAQYLINWNITSTWDRRWFDYIFRDDIKCFEKMCRNPQKGIIDLSTPKSIKAIIAKIRKDIRSNINNINHDEYTLRLKNLDIACKTYNALIKWGRDFYKIISSLEDNYLKYIDKYRNIVYYKPNEQQDLIKNRFENLQVAYGEYKILLKQIASYIQSSNELDKLIKKFLSLTQKKYINGIVERIQNRNGKKGKRCCIANQFLSTLSSFFHECNDICNSVVQHYTSKINRRIEQSAFIRDFTSYDFIVKLVNFVYDSSVFIKKDKEKTDWLKRLNREIEYDKSDKDFNKYFDNNYHFRKFLSDNVGKIAEKCYIRNIETQTDDYTDDVLNKTNKIRSYNKNTQTDFLDSCKKDGAKMIKSTIYKNNNINKQNDESDVGTQTDTINTSELSTQTDDINIDERTKPGNIFYNTDELGTDNVNHDTKTHHDTQIQVGDDSVSFYKNENFYKNVQDNITRDNTTNEVGTQATGQSYWDYLKENEPSPDSSYDFDDGDY